MVNMPDYFKPKHFETYKQRTIYEYMGIRQFKKYLITDGDVVRKWKKIRHINLDRNNRILELQHAEKETRKYEISHLVFIFITLVILFFNYHRLSSLQWILIIVISIYANIYPIFLQRFNRIRILRVLKIASEKQQSSQNFSQ